MDLFSMIATLPVVASTFWGAPDKAEETVNTNIKTKFVIQKNVKIENGKIIKNNFENIPFKNESYVPVQFEEDLAREEKLSYWQSRQSHLKANLPKDKFIGNFSAYTAAADECGKSDGITASGVKVKIKRTLACPPQYPFGTKIEISGYGTFVCEDRGGAIKGNKFDIYMETKKEAFAFGRRYLETQVVD